MTDYDEYETPPALVNLLLNKVFNKLEKPRKLTYLDPCTGSGNWFTELNRRNLDVHYCEILEGLDFYKVSDTYDIIVGNPPFSQTSKWLMHTAKTAKLMIGYILPAHGLSYRRLSLMEDFGWKLTAIHSFDNPKAWNLGFAHFFCIWEKTENQDLGTEPIGRAKGVQRMLGDFI